MMVMTDDDDAVVVRTRERKKEGMNKKRQHAVGSSERVKRTSSGRGYLCFDWSTQRRGEWGMDCLAGPGSHADTVSQ